MSDVASTWFLVAAPRYSLLVFDEMRVRFFIFIYYYLLPISH
jgi:hypothetical protein